MKVFLLLNMFRMLLHSSSGAGDCMWVYCSVLVCTGVLVRFGWSTNLMSLYESFFIAQHVSNVITFILRSWWLYVGLLLCFGVYWCIGAVRLEYQLDVTLWKLFYCSTCFECYYIHPQELVTVCRCTTLFRCVLVYWCGSAGVGWYPNVGWS